MRKDIIIELIKISLYWISKYFQKFENISIILLHLMDLDEEYICEVLPRDTIVNKSLEKLRDFGISGGDDALEVSVKIVILLHIQ